ncbi:YebC/PmpR family DNA-binding transcriptional regulator [Candidatus Peregrinibacteria bacterium]|nr:MAG: YebC/PmpR family DNA-binding transcriptional regulator [Candidatus Peregrinibacteria bacterium]
MSGHSKWHSIRHKKGANDAVRGKIFTRHAKLIAIAARSGGDPETNPALRLAIENSKKENMPNANIDRAIKKGTGEDKDGAQMMEILYEGYGPNGVAILVEVLTDNKNRTVSSIRSIFSKNGGSLGESGSVAFLFEKKGVIFLGKTGEEAELAAIDAGAEDVREQDDMLEVITDPTDLYAVKKTLEEAGFPIESAELSFLPGTTIDVSNEESARKIIHLLELLEDDDDVTRVFSNSDIPEEILERLL